MLVIRPQQIRSFEESLTHRFNVQCVEYVQTAHPVTAARFPDTAGLESFTAGFIERAKSLGFREKEHFRRLLDWECEFGAVSGCPPEMTWLRDILEGGLSPATRVHRIENRIRILRERGEI